MFRAVYRRVPVCVGIYTCADGLTRPCVLFSVGACMWKGHLDVYKIGHISVFFVGGVYVSMFVYGGQCVYITCTQIFVFVSRRV